MGKTLRFVRLTVTAEFHVNTHKNNMAAWPQAAARLVIAGKARMPVINKLFGQRMPGAHAQKELDGKTSQEDASPAVKGEQGPRNKLAKEGESS